ncbi:Uncharacterised protein [uncultured archaeon]|nr:Uncharacterised protein [uncultured archaeon]
MPDQAKTNLNDILRDERKPKLVPLEKDFYDRIARQIQELEEEKKKIADTYGTKYAIIDDELKTARKAIESVIERRTKKIITEASLRASSKQKEKQDLESMTLEERIFYNRLLEVITEWRDEIHDRILGRIRETVISQDVVVSREAVPVENNNKEIEIEDKKDISKEYIVVRLLKEIPTFVGADGRNYTLAKEDVAVLSALNARALINRKAAVQIPVKR